VSDPDRSSAELVLPRSDEPPDFRRQASSYGRYRRDYSRALYDAIAGRTGAAAGRRALDLGCGTGFVSAELTRRGWSVVGGDFSAPMLSEARRFLGDGAALVRARAEQLPFGERAVSLVTCGTAFHWFGPRPTLEEMQRILVPGGWVALFWRYPTRDAVTPKLVREVLERFGPKLPDQHFLVHSPEPFRGSSLEVQETLVLPTSLHFTPEEFHGYAATTELLRRFAGAHHAEFLAALREELERRYPGGIEEKSEEYLYLARRP
jgi:ubiquinone/menaquinone biosynthesis C-methylase UbiE